MLLNNAKTCVSNGENKKTLISKSHVDEYYKENTSGQPPTLCKTSPRETRLRSAKQVPRQ